MVICSIIVPLFHGQKYLSNLLNMAENNANNLSDKMNLELIIINDDPQTKINIPDCENKLFILKYFENEINRGIHATRIRGVEEASGDYILFLDQDDLIEDNYIAIQLGNIGVNDAIVCNGYWRQKETIIKKMSKQENDFENYLKHGYPLVSLGQILIKKAEIPQEWLRHPLTQNGWDDHFMWACLVYQKAQIEFINRFLYTHVEHESNESFNWMGMKKSGLEFRKFFEINVKMSTAQKLMFQSIIDKKIVKYDKYKTIDDLWKQVEDKRLIQYFYANSYYKIAIYGMGIWGKRLYQVLQKSEVKVVYGIDRNAKEKYIELPVLNEKNPEIITDLIVCATGFDDEKIKEQLNGNTITLFDLLKKANVL